MHYGKEVNMDNRYSDVDKSICLNAWYGNDAKKIMEVLCKEIGPRPTAGESIKKARGYLTGELNRSGINKVWEEEMPAPLWIPEAASIEVMSSENRRYDCIQNLFSVSGEVEGSLLDLGTCDEKTLREKGSRAKGSVILLEGMATYGGKYSPMGERLNDLLYLEPAAIILRSMKRSIKSAYINAISVEKDFPVPCVSISPEVEENLMNDLKKGAVRVRVKTKAKRKESVCSNLIADIKASNNTDEMVILGAHLDSFWISPGAGDDLTGVVTVMEIARLLYPFRDRFKRNLRIVLFTGEELYYIGSKNYIKAHREELDSVRFVFTLDNLYTSTARGAAVIWTPEIRDYIDEMFKDMGVEMEVREMFCMSSDYLPFILEGVPAGRQSNFYDPVPSASHTVMDDLENIHIDWIQHNAMVFARMMARFLMDVGPIPGKRLAKEKVYGLIEDDARKSLIYEGFDI